MSTENLDPQISAERRAEKRAAEDEAPPLEPPFPFSKIPFDPSYFGADGEVDTEREGAT
ncbi:MAG: hypothetical protein QOE70_5347 [Chthoniobacter sp.]|jgi:hypothetical protein|nr:hypothetical protein [Chthoniobacter sp.]